MELTDVDRVKYVAVEMLSNTSDKVKDVECGLFIGITRRKDKDKIISFIVVALTNSLIKIFNLEEYGIVTLELVEDMTRFTTIFQNTESDQTKAIATLDFIVDSMQQEGRLLKNDLKHELIDVDTYSEYDNWIISTGGNLSAYGEKGADKSTTKNLPVTTVKKVEKKPELFFIEKKDELITKPSLEYMHELVKVLDKFKGILPICNADIHDKDAEVIEAEIIDEDIYSGDFYNTHGLY